MAPRKKPVLEPVLDNSAAAETDKYRCQDHLTRGDLNNILRTLRQSSIEVAGQVRAVTWENLKRLGLKRDLSKAATRTPRGSDQVELGTVFRWMRSIPPGPEHKKCHDQLICIDATAQKRFKG